MEFKFNIMHEIVHIYHSSVFHFENQTLPLNLLRKLLLEASIT